MPANGAIYLQVDKIDLTKIFDNVKSNKTLFKKPTYYEVNFNGDIVRFNIMESSKVTAHINSFLDYISSLNQNEERKKDASYAIGHTKIVLGLLTDKEFEDNNDIWQSLFIIADKYNGFVFVQDSVLLPSGSVLIGPLLE